MCQCQWYSWADADNGPNQKPKERIITSTSHNINCNVSLIFLLDSFTFWRRFFFFLLCFCSHECTDIHHINCVLYFSSSLVCICFVSFCSSNYCLLFLQCSSRLFNAFHQSSFAHSCMFRYILALFFGYSYVSFF